MGFGAGKTASEASISLEFIIPTYKRLGTAILAAQSILDQCDQLPADFSLCVRIHDDASPGLTDDQFKKITSVLPEWIVRGRNPANLGMSENIYSLVRSSRADFCTILTDDDALQPGVLGEIARELAALRRDDGTFQAAALFIPRYSYLEDGSLYCIVCNPFEHDELIAPSPSAVMRFADNGFILTGLFFKPERVDFRFWHKHRTNAFFPVIYLGALLASESVAYRNRNWFQHTVLNLCHWDGWGKTEKQRQARLCHDYLEAIAVLRERSLATTPGHDKGEIHQLAFLNYRTQVNSYSQYVDFKSMLRAVPFYLFFQLDFLRAFSPFLIRSLRSSTKKFI
jgi:glycosyltransferase involved in cell wall biosynthesis